MENGEDLSPELINIGWEAVYRSNDLFDQLAQTHGTPKELEAKRYPGMDLGELAISALDAGYAELDSEIGEEFEETTRLANKFALMENSPLAPPYETGDNEPALVEVKLSPLQQKRAETLLQYVIDKQGDVIGCSGRKVATAVREETGLSGVPWYSTLELLSELELLTIKKTGSPEYEVIAAISLEINNIAVLESLVEQGKLSRQLQSRLNTLKENRLLEGDEEEYSDESYLKVENEEKRRQDAADSLERRFKERLASMANEKPEPKQPGSKAANLKPGRIRGRYVRQGEPEELPSRLDFYIKGLDKFQIRFTAETFAMANSKLRLLLATGTSDHRVNSGSLNTEENRNSYAMEIVNLGEREIIDERGLMNMVNDALEAGTIYRDEQGVHLTEEGLEAIEEAEAVKRSFRGRGYNFS
jgi:hypothetical protein